MSALQTHGWTSIRTRPAPVAGLTVLGGEQLPVSLGDDFDGAVGDLYGCLIVNRIRRYWYPGGPSFCVGHGVVRKVLVIQVRERSKNPPLPALRRHRWAAS